MNLLRPVPCLAYFFVLFVTSASAQQDRLRFTQPTQPRIADIADIEVAAPPDTTAIRFYLDDTQLSELTNAYALETKTPAVWHTILSAAWGLRGLHTLKAVATTLRGSLSTSMQVDFIQPISRDISLDGGWHFASGDDLPFGSLDSAHPSIVSTNYVDDSWPKVAVPNSIDAVDSRWMKPQGLLGIYRRTFRLSSADLSQELYLRSESCFWSCRYFINGTEVGSSVGGYLPRRMRITPAAHAGENVIAVIVDSRPATMGVFNRLRYYYWNYTGLLQDIAIERFAPAALTEFRAQGTASGALTLLPSAVNTTRHEVRLPVAVDILDPSSHVVLTERREIHIPANGDPLEPIHLKLAQPQLWDLEHPHLYTVRIHTPHQTLSETMGFRDIAIQDGDLTLNGVPVLGLQGFDRHADSPGLGRSQPDAFADREIKLLHDKGFRIFRPAHYPTTEAELAAADKYGMLVLEEIDVTGLSGNELESPAVIDFAHQQLSFMIARDRSHPSIFGWSIGNENRTDQPGSPTYVQNLIAFGKQLDPTRPFTEVSAQLRHDICYRFMDFLAVNIYAGWYTPKLTDVVPELDALAAYAGNKPMVITEYGAEGVYQRRGTGKGSEYFQAQTVDVHNQLLRNRAHFIGKMYWTSTELIVSSTWTGGNPNPIPPYHAKGLLTYYRQPKLAWRVMFSPVGMDDLAPIEVDTAQLPVKKTIRVVLHNRERYPVHGDFLITPPTASTVSIEHRSFSLPPAGTTELTFDVTIQPLATHTNDYGMVRAVIGDQTESLPQLLQVRRTCASCEK